MSQVKPIKLYAGMTGVAWFCMCVVLFYFGIVLYAFIIDDFALMTLGAVMSYLQYVITMLIDTNAMVTYLTRQQLNAGVKR
jgi:hypothetical protein